nr:putative KHDC1-like protein [Macaca nemestrina]
MGRFWPEDADTIQRAWAPGPPTRLVMVSMGFQASYISESFLFSPLVLPGLDDTYLRCIELHSHTLIQLESCFTATGQTRVTVVGPPMAKQWLLLMFRSVGSHYSKCHAQGLKMLERVRSQPLTNDDLVASISLPPYTGD